MADKRLRGQECQVQVLQDGTLVGAVNAVLSMNDSALFEKSSTGFLGEVTERKDYIFNGFDGSAELHVSEQGWMNMQQAARLKAQHIQPNLVFNIVTLDSYANGDSPSRTYPDVSWGPMPKTVGSRSDFVTVGLDWSTEDVVDNLDGVI